MFELIIISLLCLRLSFAEDEFCSSVHKVLKERVQSGIASYCKCNALDNYIIQFACSSIKTRKDTPKKIKKLHVRHI